MFLANQFLLMLNFMLAIVVDSYGKHSDGLSREGGREGEIIKLNTLYSERGWLTLPRRCGVGQARKRACHSALANRGMRGRVHVREPEDGRARSLSRQCVN